VKNLIKYAAERNAVRKLMRLSPLDVNSIADLRVLAELVEGDLSPENLTCDGELPRDVVVQRHTYLIAVAKQIKQRDPSIRFWELDHG
jgi:hypothetical protein